MIANEELSQLKGLSEYFVARKLRARQRLTNGSQPGWYFGILGFDVDMPSSSFALLPDVAVIEEVVEPPGEVELASSLKDQQLFSSIARYSHGIRYQLRIHDFDGTVQGSFNLAWWIISLVRVRTSAEFLVPVAANHSWDVIAGLNAQTCEV